MNNVSSSPRRGAISIVLAVLGAGTLLALLGIANLVTLTREAGALRQAVVGVDGLEPRLIVQGSAGSWLCAAARQGVRWIDDVPTEAHQALGALRGVSVAVYQLEQAPAPALRQRLAQSAAEVMQQRGWTRTVSVREADSTVLVFTRAGGWRDTQLHVAVAVCAQNELIVAEGQLAAAPLGDLLQPYWPGQRAI